MTEIPDEKPFVEGDTTNPEALTQSLTDLAETILTQPDERGCVKTDGMSLVQEDGTVTTSVMSRTTGAALRNIATPDGGSRFEFSELYYAITDEGRDRGAMIYAWEKGAPTVDRTDNSEVRGDSTATLEDDKSMAEVLRKLNKNFPEIKAAPPEPRRNVAGRLLGKMTLFRSSRR